jgi:tetratricopeptide (TPR) repeat protein
MNGMIDQAQNRDALKRAEEGGENVMAEEKILADALKHLLEQPGAGDPVAKDVLEACGRQLAVVRGDRANLAKTIGLLKDAVAKVGTPAALEKEFRVNELVERIKGHLARGDVDEALKAYDLLIAEKPNQASLKDEREKLLAEWTPQDEAHRAARDAIRTLAAAKQPEDFKAACDAVKKATGVMKEKKDKLGLRKLMNGFEPAIAAFYALLHQADAHAATPENQEALAKLNDLLTDLRQCETLVRNALKDLAEKK